MDAKGAEEYITSRLKNELKPDLYYHGVHHTFDVVNAAMELAKAENISEADKILLRTAALYHDSGFVMGYKNHEDASCELAKTSLPKYDFSDAHVQKICGMIQATQIPQKPTNLLEEIIVDADLDYLGRDDFEPIAESLFRELLAYGIVQDEKEWNRLQVKFFESHHYFTKTANEKRNAKKQAQLAKIKELVATYDASA